MNGEKLLGDTRLRLIRVVYDQRQKKQVIVRHVERALDRQAPFPAEITFEARLGSRRDDRHEIIAFADLLADLLVPGVAAAELALVEPDIETEARQCIADGPGGLAIIRGVT